MTTTKNTADELKAAVLATRTAYTAALAAHAADLPAEPVPGADEVDADGTPNDAFFESEAWLAYEEADEAAHARHRLTERAAAVGEAEDALIDWAFDAMTRDSRTAFAFRRIAGTLEKGRRSVVTRRKLADLALRFDGRIAA